MKNVRHACVAGSFYPADPAQLRAEITACYQASAKETAGEPAGSPVKALIAPHAGYIFSGPIAAAAYGSIKSRADDIKRVVLLGPAHRYGFRGLALCEADWFETPLGSVPIEHGSDAALLNLPQVQRLDVAFNGEHCLEVQLPFLQELLPDFSLLPVLVGEANPSEVAQVLELLWGGDDTLIVISSDLSHFLDDHRARTLDSKTARAILSLNAEAIGPQQACGRYPIAGLLLSARAHGLKVEQLDLRNSSQTAGSPDRVVGYGAYVFH